MLLTAALGLGSAFLKPGLGLAAVSDIVSALLMLSALLAFAVNGAAGRGRTRVFWWLQAAGWGLWLSDQLMWILFDLILQRKMPSMYPADALLFLAGAPMVAGLLLRPHVQPSERSARLGLLDFLLLQLWWLYLYASFVVCWQYVVPNQTAYDFNFDVLAGLESVLLAVVSAVFCYQSSGRWRKFYAGFFVAVVFNGIVFYILNHALEEQLYYTGSWYDVPYAVSFVVFTAVALSGRGLGPTASTADDRYPSWIASLAMMAVLSLPVMAMYGLLGSHIPAQAAGFRVLLTLGTMFVMALILFVQHNRLNKELRRTNNVLEEASLTDPLTGVRNRRYFSATITSDVSQALRAYADGHDPRTRDLVFYLIDADDFKEINDRYGHDAGDRVLVEMALRIRSSIRHSDVLIRWGGEEFLIISRYTNRDEAGILAERLLAGVGGTPFLLDDSEEKIYRTCSVGWAAFPWLPHDPKVVGYEEVLNLADRGLNQAKRSGKNRAVAMMPAADRRGHPAGGRLSNGLHVDVLSVAGPSHAG